MDAQAVLALAIEAANKGDRDTLEALAVLAEDSHAVAVEGWGDASRPATAEATKRIKQRQAAFHEARMRESK